MDLEVRVSKTRAISNPTFISTETSAVFLLLAHLPGFNKVDIEVQINETRTEIIVSGGGRIESLEFVNVFRIVNIAERVKVQGFCQGFLVPENADFKRVDAVFDEEEEILMILIPKLVKEQTEEIESEEVSCTGSNDKFLEEEESLINFHEPILDLIQLEDEDKNRNTDTCIPAELTREGDTVNSSDIIQLEEEESLVNFHEPILDLIQLEDEDKNRNADTCTPAEITGEGDTVNTSDLIQLEEEESLTNFHEPILDLIQLEDEDKNRNADTCIPAELTGEGDTINTSDQLPCFPKKVKDIDEKLFDHDANVEAIIPLSSYVEKEDIVDIHMPKKVPVEDINPSTKLPKEEPIKAEEESVEAENSNQTTEIEPYKQEIQRFEEPPYSQERLESRGTNQIQEKLESKGQASTPNFKSHGQESIEPKVPKEAQEDEPWEKEPIDEFNEDAENEEGSHMVEETEEETQMSTGERKRIMKRSSFHLTPTSLFAGSIFIFVVVLFIRFLKGKKPKLSQ